VLVFTLFAGVVADRVPRRGMVITTQCAAMVLAFALAALVLANVVQVWHLVVLATLLGISNAFDMPARHALMLDLVGKKDLTNAIALNSSAFNATRVLGPAIAGALIAAVGVGICFLLNGVSYLAVIASLVAIKLTADGRTGGPSGSMWSRLRDGFRHVWQERRTRTLIMNIAVISIFGLPAMVLMPVMARDVLGRGAETYGMMMSAIGVGALAGALGLAVVGDRVPRGRLLTWSATAFGIAVVLFGVSRWFPFSLAALVALGLSMIITSALTNTLVQTLAPDELRARVVAFYAWAFVGLSPFGAIQAGAVAEWLGTGAAIALGGGICVVAALGLLARSTELAETR
jgi:MFS family permease